MKRPRIENSLAVIVAFCVGVTVMLSLLLGDNPALFGGGANAESLAETIALPADVMLRLLAILLALSIAFGIANLLLVHARRVASGRLMSLVILASFAGTIAWHWWNAGDTSLMEIVQLPIETSLAALLCVTAGGWRRARIVTAQRHLGIALCCRGRGRFAGQFAAAGSRPATRIQRLAAARASSSRRPRHIAGHRAGQRRGRRPRPAGGKTGALAGLSHE